MIVIPMVGRSRRFLDAGYAVPKYRLTLWDRSVFSLALSSFRHVAQLESVLIICLEDDQSASFVRSEMKHLGLPRWKVVELSSMTYGQADTVMQGLRLAESDLIGPITIFNVDTFRPGFRYPTEFVLDCVDGYLECFVGAGTNWSNVVPDSPDSTRVLRTSEKQQESELCCTGLYYFRSASSFIEACEREMSEQIQRGGMRQEIYVAPLYNKLIAEGLDVRFNVVDREEVIFCGIPSEYESLRSSHPMPPTQLLVDE